MAEPHTLFVCTCGDIDHQFVVQFFPEEKFNDTTMIAVHLNNLSWWKRLHYGIRYILGKKSRYIPGAFSEVLLDKKKTKQLIEVLQSHYSQMV